LISLHSFPTRRSSDLLTEKEPAAEEARVDPVFRPATDKEQADAGPGIVIGQYTLVPEAVETLNKIHTLELTLNEIKHFDWKTPQDRKSTRLNSSHVKI